MDLAEEKRVHFFNVYFVQRNFFKHYCFISVYSVLNKLSEYLLFSELHLHIKKHYFIHFLLFFLNPSKALSVFLTQPALTCSKLTIETLEQGMKYVQS